MKTDDRKPRILKASRLLQAKVGTGPEVDAALVRKSQQIIDDNTVDFIPLAGDYLAALHMVLKDAKSGAREEREILQDMVRPVMHLKANAGMFQYPLIGNLATIMLNFLETLEGIDPDVIEIVEVHQKALNVLINNEIRGGGESGEELVRELRDACRRYFSKRGIQANGKNEGFFVEG